MLSTVLLHAKAGWTVEELAPLFIAGGDAGALQALLAGQERWDDAFNVAALQASGAYTHLITLAPVTALPQLAPARNVGACLLFCEGLPCTVRSSNIVVTMG